MEPILGSQLQKLGVTLVSVCRLFFKFSKYFLNVTAVSAFLKVLSNMESPT